jgi:16S rRNA (guanine527-N7)-methyltransferase
MPTLTPTRIAELLAPYTPAPSRELCAQLALYLDLILKWNERINLTAIRSPEEIVRRHFGESLFAGTQLDPAHLGPTQTLLDFGSGAGFPGLPIQLLRPDIAVTLAESRARKSAFLREAVRTLAVRAEIWSQRVESMPPDRTFDVVTLRAVDEMDLAIQAAAPRASQRLAIFSTALTPVPSILSSHFDLADPIPIPESTNSILRIAQRR